MKSELHDDAVWARYRLGVGQVWTQNAGVAVVGLPLAVEFGKKFETIGYDLSEAKINHYKNYCDPTGEVSTEDLKAAAMLSVSSDPAAIAKADFIIIAVPPRWTTRTSLISRPWLVLPPRSAST